MLYIFLCLGLIALWSALMFNRLVKAKNMVKEAFSGVDVQLKLRFDLIPNLVEIVKGTSAHEKNLFENIAQLRSQNISASNTEKRNTYEGEITHSLKDIFAVVENYPELKANESFLELQKNLTDIEDQLQYARRYFNGIVRDYNILIETFPSNIIARLFNYKKEDYFEIEYITQRENQEVRL